MALMSPTSIVVFRDASLSFGWKHLITQANRAAAAGTGQYIRKFPSSLLLTTELNKTDADGKAQQIQPYVLLGARSGLAGALR